MSRGLGRRPDWYTIHGVGILRLLHWSQYTMYAQTIGPLKVSKLAQWISQRRLRMSGWYIMPAHHFEFEFSPI